MNWSVLLIPTACAFVGGFIGVWHGDKQGGDFNFAPLYEGMFGMIAGGVVGIVLAATVG